MSRQLMPPDIGSAKIASNVARFRLFTSLQYQHEILPTVGAAGEVPQAFPAALGAGFDSVPVG